MGFQASAISTDPQPGSPAPGAAPVSSVVEGNSVVNCHRCGAVAAVEGAYCSACEAQLPQVQCFSARLIRQQGQSLIEVTWAVAHSQEIYLGDTHRDLPPQGTLTLVPGEQVLLPLALMAYNDYGHSVARLQIAQRVPQIREFTVAEEVVSLDYPSIFSWQVDHAEKIVISGVGEVTGRSFVEHQLPAGGVYRLQASNSAGIVEAQVTLTLPQPEILSFFANHETIQLGESRTLHWELRNAAEVRLEPLGEDVSGHSRWEVQPDRSTRYELVATNASGEVRQSLELTLPAPEIDFFDGDAVSTEGGKVSLAWSVQNAHTITLEPGVGEVPAQGEVRLRPAEAFTTFRLTAEGHSGTTYAEFEVVRFPIPLEWDDLDAQFNASLAMDAHSDSTSQEKITAQPQEKALQAETDFPMADDPRIRRVQEMDLDQSLVLLERGKARKELVRGLRKLKRILLGQAQD